MITHDRLRCIAAGAALLFVPCLLGKDYTYMKIVDNAPESRFTNGNFAYLAINNNGQVAFNATLKSGRPGVFAGSGGPITTILEEGGDISGTVVTGINDAGIAVFAARSGTVIYTGSGAQPPFLVAAKSIDLDLEEGISFPSINNNGTVALATLNAVFTRTGSGPLQTLLRETDLPRANAFLAPVVHGVGINNSGVVSFAASSVGGSPCQCGLFTKGPGSPVQMAEFDATLTPPINDSGAVAFAGDYQDRFGVFVAKNGSAGAAVDFGDSGSGPTLNPFTIGLNNNGQVAYWGQFHKPYVGGIFTGVDPRADKVIGTGDSLFGSTVSMVGFLISPAKFLNDKGQVAFVYTLTNGISGIAVATPVASAISGPSLPANSIVNAGSFSAESVGAPGSLISLFGTNFIDQLAISQGYPLPTSLNGVTVTLNGIAAPLFFVSPGQINAQVPFELTSTTAEVRVNTPAGQSEVRSITIASQSPSIFALNQRGFGQGAIVFNSTGTVVGPITPGTDWRPARSGDIITIYANGLGAVTPPIANGSNSCEHSVCAPDLTNVTLRRTAVLPVIEIGGMRVPDTMILFAGLAPQFVGLYQINLRIPDGVQSGSVPIVIRQGTNSSASNVLITTQ